MNQSRNVTKIASRPSAIFSQLLPYLAAAIVFTVGVSMSGCASKDAASSSTAAHPVAGAASAGTPTPKQEAAKQRAIQEGPAIEAALQAQQHGR